MQPPGILAPVVKRAMQATGQLGMPRWVEHIHVAVFVATFEYICECEGTMHKKKIVLLLKYDATVHKLVQCQCGGGGVDVGVSRTSPCDNSTVDPVLDGVVQRGPYDNTAD
jgi:hypothetical protein